MECMTLLHGMHTHHALARGSEPLQLPVRYSPRAQQMRQATGSRLLMAKYYRRLRACVKRPERCVQNAAKLSATRDCLCQPGGCCTATAYRARVLGLINLKVRKRNATQPHPTPSWGCGRIEDGLRRNQHTPQQECVLVPVMPYSEDAEGVMNTAGFILPSARLIQQPRSSPTSVPRQHAKRSRKARG